MTTIRWTTRVAYVLHLDDEEQAEWNALTTAAERDSWLADKEADDTGFDAVEERDWQEDEPLYPSPETHQFTDQ